MILSRRLYIQILTIVLACTWFVLPVFISYAQGTLPIASTVTVAGEALQTGSVVAYNQDQNEFVIADMYNDADAYGVIAERPALVFTTASGTVPVVHEGTAYVRVIGSSTPLMRGDLLIASGQGGSAMLAGKDDEHVFAVALEVHDGQGEKLVLADVSVLRAREIFAARKQTQIEAESASEEEKSPIPVTWIRGSIAAIIAVGALAFMLFSFRSIVNNGVVSVGRNPRAQTSIVTFAFGTVLGVVLLGGLALFVAIAVLVLPV